MRIKILTLLISLLLLAACKVTFVPDYDAGIEQQITNAAKENDKLYLKLLNAALDKRDYKDYEQEYIEIEADINSIELRNEARRKSGDMLNIIRLVHKHFTEYKEEHKNAAKPLSDAQIIDYQNDMKALWKPLLLAEQGLPHETPNQ
jgi:hypothetical protein